MNRYVFEEHTKITTTMSKYAFILISMHVCVQQTQCVRIYFTRFNNFTMICHCGANKKEEHFKVDNKNNNCIIEFACLIQFTDSPAEITFCVKMKKKRCSHTYTKSN